MNNFIGFLLMIIIGCVVVVGCQEKGMFAKAGLETAGVTVEGGK